MSATIDPTLIHTSFLFVFGTSLVLIVGTGQIEMEGMNTGFLGYIYLPAFGLLTVGSIIGVRLTIPFAGRIPDKLHAHIYLRC